MTQYVSIHDSSYYSNDVMVTHSNGGMDYDNRQSSKPVESSDDSFKKTTNKSIHEENSINIYRYKFTEEYMSYLYEFSKIHQYDDRIQFKEAWNIWVEENKDKVEMEQRRLLHLQYEGDILDKMFKSARYYFRKKSTQKIQPKERRPYIHVNKELLEKMDVHIQQNVSKKDYQPKSGFVSFCKEYKEVLQETIHKICEKGITDSVLIEEKMKKTYKNRYFILINK